MKWLVTGGAGFIGANSAVRLAKLGHEVVVLDNLSRKGAELNLTWLQEHSEADFVRADIRNFAEVKSVLILIRTSMPYSTWPPRSR